ncbi:hypothetical protein RUM43_006548 [Polyplax serrata]|uniref:Uncharacterized protein n=1 Tax=Polyplax serrata TaxID=468196 RepID=A0AAN8PYU1_POLSC
MYGSYLPLLTLTLLYITGSGGFKLVIQKELQDGRNLPRNERTKVEVAGVCPENPDGTVTVNVKMTDVIAQRNPNTSIFFANNDENILRVEFNEQIKLTLYKSPYKVDKVINVMELGRSNKSIFHHYFPHKWLPKNITKISGALEFPDGTIHNVYGIKNYMFSIPDLMILEEYENFICNV